MKKLLIAMSLIAVMVLVMAPTHSYAQSGTLVVYASGPTIDQIIGADTLTGGIQKHSAYQLVSVDTTYLLDATITLKSSVSIVGVPGPNGQLPCIQADVLTGGAIPGIFFTLTGAGTRVSLDSLYLLAVAPNNLNNTESGQGVQVSANDITLSVNNCVFDNMSQFDFAYSANGDNFYIFNSKFRNGIDVASAYYVPELLRSLNGSGSWDTDTIDVKDNTLIGVAMGPVETTGLTTYMNFSHNDVILTSKGPFWSEREANLVFDNNIFYNTYAVGETPTEYFGGWDELAPPRTPSVFYLDVLDSLTAAKLLGHASTGAGDPAAEALRKIEVKDNDAFWSSGLTSFWTSWNDTAKVYDLIDTVKGSMGQDSVVTIYGDSLYTPVFMNSQTAAMFSNTTDYPLLVQSGNVNTDPGFGPSINAALSPASSDTADGVGLVAWVTDVRNGKGTTQFYAYQRTEIAQPEPQNWVPAWPLPEATDLKYSSTALTSTDGKPVGDPYWFTGVPTGVKTAPQSVANTFSLSNNYPNPFNPTTQINYSLVKSGYVTVRVYNTLGQEVASLFAGNQTAGSHFVTFDGSRFASGIYFYQLRSAGNSITKKMVLLK
ncbi:MAG: T9SS type A sorting domain-containing protein [Candidatus Kryptoniota bacterium]